jgi:hypothetical protein
MSLDDYRECAKLADVADFAAKSVTAIDAPWVSNFCMKAKFSAKLLIEPELLDVAPKAKLWQETTCPRELFFSHGEYLGDRGIQHIADELKAKPSSNRALASLICVDDILDSGDRPLPSFLVFQCLIDGATLYVTAMYRAMEVGTFFRINLEEIRMMALEVYKANRTVKQVALCVFVTRAYVKEGMNPLERCEIDLIPQIELLSENRHRLPTLLRDKRRQSTYPDATGLENVLGIAKSSKLPPELQIPGNGPALQTELERAIADTLKLQTLRETTSHHSDITKLEEDLAETLEKLAARIETALRGGLA